MKINKPVIEVEQKKNRAISWRMKIIFLLVTLLTLLTSTFYFYYTSTNTKLQEAQRLQEFSKIMEEEKQNCSQILSQGEGAFGQYEYCTRLLNTFNK